MAGLAGASPDCGSEKALIQPHIFKAEQRLTSVLGTLNNRTLSVCCLVVGEVGEGRQCCQAGRGIETL